MVTIIQLSQVVMCAYWATPNRSGGAAGTAMKVTAAAIGHSSVGRAWRCQAGSLANRRAKVNMATITARNPRTPANWWIRLAVVAGALSGVVLTRPEMIEVQPKKASNSGPATALVTLRRSTHAAVKVAAPPAMNATLRASPPLPRASRLTASAAGL